MKMRTVRRLAQQAPRYVRRRRPSGPEHDGGVTSEPEPGPAPEAIFDRTSGPFGRHAAGSWDEET